MPEMQSRLARQEWVRVLRVGCIMGNKLWYAVPFVVVFVVGGLFAGWEAVVFSFGLVALILILVVFSLYMAERDDDETKNKTA